MGSRVEVVSGGDGSGRGWTSVSCKRGQAQLRVAPGSHSSPGKGDLPSPPPATISKQESALPLRTHCSYLCPGLRDQGERGLLGTMPGPSRRSPEARLAEAEQVRSRDRTAAERAAPPSGSRCALQRPQPAKLGAERTPEPPRVAKVAGVATRALRVSDSQGELL